MKNARILVGSMNPSKLAAVNRAFQERPDIFTNWKIVGQDASSEVASQPRTLEETFRGAANRIKNMEPIAGGTHDYRVSLESGIFTNTFGSIRAEPRQVFLPSHHEVTFDLTVCLIQTSWTTVPGLSSAWVLPTGMAPREGKSLGDYVRDRGHEDVPYNGMGILGLVSGGQVTREAYMYEAVRNALITLHPRWNPER